VKKTDAVFRSIDDENHKLRVSIEIDSEDGGRITIRDNAAGIAEADFLRAFRPAQLPPNRTGLSEFGMGMKSAACWFAPKWSVRTSALGELVERTVVFDIDHRSNATFLSGCSFRTHPLRWRR